MDKNHSFDARDKSPHAQGMTSTPFPYVLAASLVLAGCSATAERTDAHMTSDASSVPTPDASVVQPDASAAPMPDAMALADAGVEADAVVPLLEDAAYYDAADDANMYLRG